MPMRLKLPGTERLPRAAYLEELEADPQGVGFAYGGVTSRHSSDAHGESIAEHTAHFSIGVSGTYLLHVGLHRGATPLPGSPFELHVVPGPAHPLSTMIPPDELPLRGYLKKPVDATTGAPSSPAGGHRTLAAAVKRSTSFHALPVGEQVEGPPASAKSVEVESSCEFRLLTRDKMGNLCTTGGADVKCTCVGRDDIDCRVTDLQDGSVRIQFWTSEAGQYEVDVRLDGLHVLGSPATMKIYKDEDTFARNDPATKAKAELEAQVGTQAETLLEAALSGGAWDEILDPLLVGWVAQAQKEMDIEKVENLKRMQAEKRAKVEAIKVEEAAKAALRESDAKARKEAKAKEKPAKEARAKTSHRKEDRMTSEEERGDAGQRGR